MPTQLNMLCQIPRLHLAWGTVKAKGSAGLSEIYPLCTECYARITYIPDIKKKEPVKIAVV